LQIILLYSLTERVQYAAVTPENISAIAAAVLTDVKLVMYTSAKRRREYYYFALRGCRSSRCCYFTCYFHVVKHPYHDWFLPPMQLVVN